MMQDLFATGQQKISNFVREFPQEMFAADETVFLQGSTVEFIYFLEKGCIKLFSDRSNERPITLHLFFPGSLLPLFCLFDESLSFSLSSVTPAVVRVIPKEKFEQFLVENADVALVLLQRSFSGMKGLLKRVSQTSQQSAVQQVAGLLIYFAEHFGKECQGEVHIETKVTHEELSRWLGLSRENVSIHMKSLERKGLIRKHRRLVIVPDVAALRAFSHLE